MVLQQKTEGEISIVEAVETLSTIAELDFDAEIAVSQSHDIVIQGKPFAYQTIHWINAKDQKETIKALREVFRTILNYLRNFYKGHYGEINDNKTIENVQEIMVLVGEAAKKLDGYTSLFKTQKLGSVKNLREFKQLENFYNNKVAGSNSKFKEIFSKSVSKDKKLYKADQEKEKETKGKYSELKHVWMDLDSVKKDVSYELMLLRKPGGTRFYSAPLLRNMKLVGDFNQNFGTRATEDSLLRARFWMDRAFQLNAEYILQGVGGILDEYVEAVHGEEHTELSSLLNKAMMALFLASNPRNLLRNSPVKACHEYMLDFQHYLRRALTSSEYRKKLAYTSNKKTKRLSSIMVDFCHSLCRAFYSRMQGNYSLREIIEVLVNQEIRSREIELVADKNWIERLELTEDAMRELSSRHANGPLLKTLGLIGKSSKRRDLGFDPVMQDNLPQRMLSLDFGKRPLRLFHIPSPTAQIYVHRCDVIPEFKAFIRSIMRAHDKKRMLLVNFQDRTSSGHHARCKALESVAKQKEFGDHLTVITMPKHTDFYRQLGHYREVDEAALFIEHFLGHVREESSGFYFPSKVSRFLLGRTIERIIEGVHTLFFEEKALLEREERLVFIELVYFFIQLKAAEICEVNFMSYSCKDALDIGAAASAQLFALAQLFTNQEWGEEEMSHLQLMLFGPALLLRERSIQAERYQRTLMVIKSVDATIKKRGYEAFCASLAEGLQQLFQVDFSKMSPEIPPYDAEI